MLDEQNQNFDEAIKEKDFENLDLQTEIVKK